MVLRAPRVGMPNLDVGTGEGIPLTGSYKRVGKDEERHAGPRCGPANPPLIQPVDGCGVQTMTADWNLVFRSRGTVAPSVILDDLRENWMNEPHFARHGRHEVRWSWETTYRLVKKKRRRRA